MHTSSHTFFFFLLLLILLLPVLIHTHTHRFPFPFRQLCCSFSTIGETSHFHMCAGRRTAKSRLKASLSWLAGSQFVSCKHRTHLSPTVFTYPHDPFTSQSALQSTGTGCLVWQHVFLWYFCRGKLGFKKKKLDAPQHQKKKEKKKKVKR